jgi:hypothetical protein
MSDTVLQLQQPLKEGAIRSVNFFNGRLLTSKDLTREQQARREADWRNGLAIGDGVAFGLEVARDATLDQAQAPVVRVKAGLALNRKGQSLRLTADTSVALSRRFDSATTSCIFAQCEPIGSGSYVAGAGVYLLTIAPAETSEGRAPTNGLDPSNVRCNTDANIEAVQFRLISVGALLLAGLDIGSLQFRNRLAYRCFGFADRENWYDDPLRADPASYGLIDRLRTEGLNDFDVPLALLYWTAGGLQFVDNWAARRELLAPDALATQVFAQRRRRLVEAHAMCAQFEQHLSDLLAATTDPATVFATQHFRYLPPFGIVPLNRSPLRGFAENAFFSSIVRRPPPALNQPTEFIDARLIGALREQALASTPTDLTEQEFIWVYRPWQNAQALADGMDVQPLVVFASGQIPTPSVARFDLARFDYSNYASCCGGV